MTMHYIWHKGRRIRQGPNYDGSTVLKNNYNYCTVIIKTIIFSFTKNILTNVLSWFGKVNQQRVVREARGYLS